MLRKLRQKKTAKKIWIILAILVLPAFVFWGFGSAVRSQRGSIYAGKIFGKNITLLEYKDAQDAIKNQAIMQFGDNYSEIKKHLNLESRAWERLILLCEAKKRRINASDREVVELIESYPFFKGRNGQFDNRIYPEMLQYVFRTQPRIFEEHTRQNIILSKLYGELSRNITLTDQEIKEAYQKENEQISLYYIASVAANFTKEVSASEREIKDYFTKNSLQFKQPLSFNIEYITFDSEEKLNFALRRLSKNEDFVKFAKKLSLPLKETGLFSQVDSIPGIGWSPEVINLISRAKAGKILEPIHIDNFYYLIKIKERKEPHIPDFITIKEKVKDAFIKERSQELAQKKVEDCWRKLQDLYKVNPKRIDFDKTAGECGLKSDTTAPFKYGSYIEGIGVSDNFWMAAKDLKENDFSQVITMPSGFYIVKLKSRIPVDEKKFEAEKTEFSQRLLSVKKETYFLKFLEELKTKTKLF